MDTIELEISKYKAMWETLKGSKRYESPNIDPVEKNMTVYGKSGKGTKFKNEYDRKIHLHHNPEMPIMIFMHTEEGVIKYIPVKENV